jgi:hypothetical protein
VRLSRAASPSQPAPAPHGEARAGARGGAIQLLFVLQLIALLTLLLAPGFGLWLPRLLSA